MNPPKLQPFHNAIPQYNATIPKLSTIILIVNISSLIKVNWPGTLCIQNHKKESGVRYFCGGNLPPFGASGGTIIH
jgi:hypothetical protein